MVVLACFIPAAQRLIVFGSDFDLLRILILFGWARLIIWQEYTGFGWNKLDSLFSAWMLSSTMIFTLQNGTFSAFINRCGWMFDGFGMYFFFRCILRDWRDVKFLVMTFVALSFPVALAFLLERATGRNVFSVFGGVPETTIVRDGRLRCQGAFAHAIMAGCFWVGVMPWMVASLVNERKWIYAASMLAVLVIVINCASSTPILALAFLCLGFLLFVARAYVRTLRWGFLLLLIVLHFIMQAPVWHLISRINVVGGSTGWHRYKIMDATINNFSEWFLLGENDPMSWGVWEMRDITNQYILEALRGGLLGLVLFVVMISVAFGMVGSALKGRQADFRVHFFVWSLGAALFTHVCIFFAVSYFGQIILVWYLTLALIGCLPRLLSHNDNVQIAEPAKRGGVGQSMEFKRCS